MPTSDNIKIEKITLDDGRRAERHIKTDENGNEVIEVFAEEKIPLKLEKRIVRETKNIISKEIHQTVKDGEVAFEEVYSLEPEVPLQIREKIAVADHAKVVDGDYVRKEDLKAIVADSVVAGVSALMESAEFQVQGKNNSAPSRSEPIFKAQEIVEKNVQEKNKSNVTGTVIVSLVFAVQVAIFIAAYYFM